MSDVFISYSRRDIAFARLIREALQESELDTWIDWDRIPIGERWWQEITEAIEGANVFLLIISRHSIGSKVCRDEIELALRNHKRIVPVLVDQLTPDEIAGLAPDLPQFNWVVFERDRIFRVEVDPEATSDKAEDRETAFPKLPQFQEALAKLGVAIHTDWEWVKYHTGLQVESLRWDNNQRDPSYLIRGTALEEAEHELLRAAGHDPQPTSLQVEFVTAARQEEARRQLATLTLERKARRRQRYVLAAVGVGLVVSSALGVVAWGQRNQYLDEAQARATAQAQTEEQRKVAVQQRDIAISRQLAAAAVNQIDNQQLDEGMLLAIEAARHADTMDARSSLLRLILHTPQLRTITAGHVDEVHAVAISPDGTTIASASADGTIGLWDVATGGAAHAPLASTEGGFMSVAFSPDGTYLATGEGGRTGSAGGRIVLWDVAAGYAPVVLADGGGAWVDELVFSRDGTTLVAGLADGSATVYAVADRSVTCPSIGQRADNQLFTAVALSPDGRDLAFSMQGGGSGALTIWNVATCRQVGPAVGTDAAGMLGGVAYSPDGRQLAVVDRDQLLVFDTATWRLLRDAAVIAENFWITAIAYSPDGSRIALGSQRTLVMLDAATGRQSGTPLLGARGSVLSVAFSADGQALAAGSSGGDVVTYDLGNAPLTTTVSADPTSVRAVAFSPVTGVLASAGADSTIRLWNATTWQATGEAMTGPEADASALVFGPDGTTLASGGADGLVHLWDASTGAQLADALAGQVGAIRCLDISPDGKWLAAGGAEDTLTLWDLASGELLVSQQYVPSPGSAPFDLNKSIQSVGFSADSSGLFFTMGGGTTRFVSWTGRQPGPDWTTRELTWQETSQANEIQGVLSPDGKTVALANLNVIRRYDVASGAILGLPMYGHSNMVSALAFSPDGRVLASAGMDSIVRLWDSATGQTIGTPLPGPSNGVVSLAFSPDGARLVGSGWDGVIFAWDMQLQGWSSLACGVASRNLSGLEWQQFMPDEPYRLTCPDQPIDASGIRQLTALARTRQAAGSSAEATAIVKDGLAWILASDEAQANNSMCWTGSLNGFAAEVMPACERAVDLAPADHLAGVRDSRGVARALTGDTQGAIADFQAMVDWSRQNDLYDTVGAQRDGWIAALARGEDPFDQQLLDSLLAD